MIFALLATNYGFHYVNVGCNVRISDGGFFRHTTPAIVPSE